MTHLCVRVLAGVSIDSERKLWKVILVEAAKLIRLA